MFKVVLKKQADKNIRKAPKRIRGKFAYLLDDLRDQGAVQPQWPNYSKLGKNTYHCRLDHHWVACWRHEKGSIIVEVYYAGSRENAPY